MKGIVYDCKKNLGYGFIRSFDDRTYFIHEDDFRGRGKLKNGIIVEFDVKKEPNLGHDRAVNVKKIGHGKNHPFIHDLKLLKEFIRENVSDDNEDKKWRIRDINMIISYFSNVEDTEAYDNPKAIFKTPVSERKE